MSEIKNVCKVVELDNNDILPNRFQPRKYFDEEEILQLSESIKEHGVLNPIIVRKLGDKYELVAGERRYKANILAGNDTIPAIIMDVNDKESSEIAVVENIQRKDLNPVEEAISYKRSLDIGYMTQEQLAQKMGKSQSYIANKIRLLKLSDEVQDALMKKQISERHARSLLKLESQTQQNEMLNRIINERLTVRKTDEEIDKMNNNVGSITNNQQNIYNQDIAPEFANSSNIQSQSNMHDIFKYDNQSQAPTFNDNGNNNQNSVITPIMPENRIPDIDISKIPQTIDLEKNFDNNLENNIDVNIKTSNFKQDNSIPQTAPIEEKITPIVNTPSANEISSQDNLYSSNNNLENNIDDSLFDSQIRVPKAVTIENINSITDTFNPNFPNGYDSKNGINESNDLLQNNASQSLNQTYPLGDDLKPNSTIINNNDNSVSTLNKIPNNSASSIQSQSSIITDFNSTREQNNLQNNHVDINHDLNENQKNNFNKSNNINQINNRNVQSYNPLFNFSPIIDTTENGENNDHNATTSSVPSVDANSNNFINTNVYAPEIKSETIPEPIIVNDYNQQYDPVMPQNQTINPTVDFKTILNLIRKCSAAIENSGYKIDTEEYNLDNIYQVIFKIEKK